jgi:hypothetical protein
VHAAADLSCAKRWLWLPKPGTFDQSDATAQEDGALGCYLHALVTAAVDAPTGLAPEQWAGYVVSMVDASVISRPGSASGDHC